MDTLLNRTVYKVYALLREDNAILAIDGGASIGNVDIDRWTLIDEGNDPVKYGGCQINYVDAICTFDGIPRYRWDGTRAMERSEEEMDSDRLPIIAAQARAQRDKLLADCDWTQTLDAPIDTDTREAYRAYRQALRDIPEQEGFPRDIVWPELPAKVKADPNPVDDAVDLLLSGATGEEAAE